MGTNKMTSAGNVNERGVNNNIILHNTKLERVSKQKKSFYV